MYLKQSNNYCDQQISKTIIIILLLLLLLLLLVLNKRKTNAKYSPKTQPIILFMYNL